MKVGKKQISALNTFTRMLLGRKCPKSASVLEQDVVQINGAKKTLNSTQVAGKEALAKVSEIKELVRGINFDALDKEKTYIGLQYGEQYKIGKAIVKFTKQYCTKSRVPVHVFGMAFKDGEWWIYESHIIRKKEIGLKRGTHKLRAQEWLNLAKNSTVETEVYEAKLDVDSLEKNAGQPYSFGDVFKHFISSVFNRNGKQSNCSGLICSEYTATAMKDVCDFFKLPPWCITPAHFKDYMVKHGAKQVNVQC